MGLTYETMKLMTLNMDGKLFTIIPTKSRVLVQTNKSGRTDRMQKITLYKYAIDISLPTYLPTYPPTYIHT